MRVVTDVLQRRKKVDSRAAFDETLAQFAGAAEQSMHRQLDSKLPLMLDYIDDTLVELATKCYTSTKVAVHYDVIIDKYQSLCCCVIGRMKSTPHYSLLFRRHYQLISNDDLRERIYKRFGQILFRHMLSPASYMYIDDSVVDKENVGMWSSLLKDYMNYFIEKHSSTHQNVAPATLFNCMKCVEQLAMASVYQLNPIEGVYVYNFVMYIFFQEKEVILNYFNETVTIFIHYSLSVTAPCKNIINRAVAKMFQKVFIFADKYGKQARNTVSNFVIFTLNLYFYDIYNAVCYGANKADFSESTQMLLKITERTLLFIDDSIRDVPTGFEMKDPATMANFRVIVESVVLIKMIHSKWRRHRPNAHTSFLAVQNYQRLYCLVVTDECWTADMLRLLQSPSYLYIYLEVTLTWITYTQGSLLSTECATVLLENVLTLVRLIFGNDIKQWSSYYVLFLTKCCDILESTLLTPNNNNKHYTGGSDASTAIPSKLHDEWPLVIDRIIKLNVPSFKVILVRLVCCLINSHIIPVDFQLINTTAVLEQLPTLHCINYFNCVFSHGNVCENFQPTQSTAVPTTNYLFRESLINWALNGIVDSEFDHDSLLTNFNAYFEFFVRVMDRYGCASATPLCRLRERKHNTPTDATLYERLRRMRLELLFATEPTSCRPLGDVLNDSETFGDENKTTTTTHTTNDNNTKNTTDAKTEQFLIVPLFDAFLKMVENLCATTNGIEYVLLFLIAVTIDSTFNKPNTACSKLCKLFCYTKIVEIATSVNNSCLVCLLVYTVTKLPKDDQKVITTVLFQQIPIQSPSFFKMTLANVIDFDDLSQSPSSFIDEQLDQMDLKLVSMIFCQLDFFGSQLNERKYINELTNFTCNHIHNMLVNCKENRAATTLDECWYESVLTILDVITSNRSLVDQCNENAVYLAECIRGLIQIPWVFNNAKLLGICVKCTNRLVNVEKATIILANPAFTKAFLFEFYAYCEQYTYEDIAKLFGSLFYNCSPHVSAFPLDDWIMYNFLIVYNVIRLTTENNPNADFYAIVYMVTLFNQYCSLHCDICSGLGVSLLKYLGNYMKIDPYRIKLYVASSGILNFNRLPLKTIEQHKTWLLLLKLNPADYDITLHQLETHCYGNSSTNDFLKKRASCELVTLHICLTVKYPITHGVPPCAVNTTNNNNNLSLAAIPSDLIELFDSVDLCRTVDSYLDYVLEYDLRVQGLDLTRICLSIEPNIYALCGSILSDGEKENTLDGALSTNQRLKIAKTLIQMLLYFSCEVVEVSQINVILANTIVHKIRLLWCAILPQNISVAFLSHITIGKLGAALQHNKYNINFVANLLGCIECLSEGVVVESVLNSAKLMDWYSGCINPYYLNFKVMNKLVLLSWLGMDHPLLNGDQLCGDQPLFVVADELLEYGLSIESISNKSPNHLKLESIDTLKKLKLKFLYDLKNDDYSYYSYLYVLIVVAYLYMNESLLFDYLRCMPSYLMNFECNNSNLQHSNQSPLDCWVEENCAVILNSLNFDAQLSHGKSCMLLSLLYNKLSANPSLESNEFLQFNDGCATFWTNQMVTVATDSGATSSPNTKVTNITCLAHYFIFHQLMNNSDYTSLLEYFNCAHSLNYDTSMRDRKETSAFIFANDLRAVAQLTQNDVIFGFKFNAFQSPKTVSNSLKDALTKFFYKIPSDSCSFVLNALKRIYYCNEFILPNTLAVVFDTLYDCHANKFVKAFQSIVAFVLNTIDLKSSVLPEDTPFYNKVLVKCFPFVEKFAIKYLLQSKQNLDAEWLSQALIRVGEFAHRLRLFDSSAFLLAISHDLSPSNHSVCNRWTDELYTSLSSSYAMHLSDELSVHNNAIHDVYNLDYDYFYRDKETSSLMTLNDIGLYGLMSSGRFDNCHGKHNTMKHDHLYLKSALSLSTWGDTHPTSWPYQNFNSVKAMQNIILHLSDSENSATNPFALVEKSFTSVFCSNNFFRSTDYANTMVLLEKTMNNIVCNYESNALTLCDSLGMVLLNKGAKVDLSWSVLLNTLKIKLWSPVLRAGDLTANRYVFEQILSNTDRLVVNAGKISLVRFYLSGVEQAKILPTNAVSLLKTLYSESLVSGRTRCYNSLVRLIESQSSDTLDATTALDSLVKYHSHLAIGKWLNESKREPSSHICTQHFKKAVEHSRQLALSNRERNYLHLCVGNFFYSLYKEKRVIYTSTEYVTLKNEVVDFHKLHQKGNELSSSSSRPRKRSSSTKKLVTLYDKTWNTLMTDDLAYVKDIENEYCFYLQSTAEHYLECFRICPKRNRTYIYRFLLLWFENRSNVEFNTHLQGRIDNIDLSLYLSVVWQLTSQLASDNSTIFTELIKCLLLKLTTLQPYHVISILLSSKSYKKNDSVILRQLLNDIELQVPVEYASLVNLWQFYHELINLDIHSSAGNDFCTDTAYAIPNDTTCRYLNSTNLSPYLTHDYHIPSMGDKCDMIYIESVVDNTFHYAGGINHPLILSMLCSDGVVRKQLLKSKDDLRQDAILQQVFVTVNYLIAEHETANYFNNGLCQRTYSVIPLSDQCGLIEWCDNTTPFGNYVNRCNERFRTTNTIGGNEFWDDSECYTRLANSTLSNKRRTFNTIVKHRQPMLHYFFYEHFENASQWLLAKCSYTNSTAVASMVGYILGLGDRHPWNILLDTSTAEVIHIDLGVAFDQGKMLSNPEIVPFRLTPEVIDGLVRGQFKQGLFFNSCEKILKLLRTHQDCILMVIRVLLNDPLTAWLSSHTNHRTGHLAAKADVTPHTNNDIVGEKTTGNNPTLYHNNRIAEKVVSKVQFKLNGMDATEYLSPSGQAKMLIDKASSFENLCRMFCGWRPYM